MRPQVFAAEWPLTDGLAGAMIPRATLRMAAGMEKANVENL